MDCKQLKNVNDGVQVWSEEITISTYSVGDPCKIPMFLEKRVYQGSSGKVYPFPIIEKIYDNKTIKKYHAICLENKYLFIMILPELGGRIQRAYDKTNGYDFVYYNQVIKPALVGLTGPWISGGIEFNWPQHHRPSTFNPVDSEIQKNPDGSCSVFVSETDRMYGTKGTAAMILYPDKAYLKIDVRLYNGTPLPQTFLWWANPAVAVNDDTQSIFPPDVTAVMDHGKREVSSFPIARGIYYKQDYSAGVDISRYKNLKVPTSYMAYRSKYDFIGGYDFGRRAGLLHVADHHISPGKKQWTWGCGDFGKAWDRNLTDEDGPYIELMTGCFTDNQPDFSWLMPYEEKTFTQYFMPYKELGAVKNASMDAALTLSLDHGKARIAVYTTAVYDKAKIVLMENGCEVFSQVVDLAPDKVFTAEEDVEAKQDWDLELRLYNENGKLMLTYQPEKLTSQPLPEPAKPVPVPMDAKTNEDLYLYGLHLEQYRHATYLPDDYYLEGLRRDSTDARINNAYGLLLMRRGQFELAEKLFQAAIQKLTCTNPNPYDGEPYTNLGVCQCYLGKKDAAYDNLYKATWNSAQQDKALYIMACIRAEKGALRDALEHVEKGLVRNAHNMRARLLKTLLLRKLGQKEEAIRCADETLSIDPTDLAAWYEKSLMEDNILRKEELRRKLASNPHWAIELALQYSDAGFNWESMDILRAHCEGSDMARVYPMIFYYLAEFARRMGRDNEAVFYGKLAAAAISDCCFPNQLDDLLVLRSALTTDPNDSKGWYYLGNLLYDKRQYEDAITAWEKSRKIDSSFPTVHRNLSLAYFNKRDDKVQANIEMETAFSLDSSNARVLMELDQLHKKLGYSPLKRLELLEKYKSAVTERDDLFVEYVTQHNMTGNYGDALELIQSYHFHPWEGGEGKISTQYVCALIGLAVQAIRGKRFNDAVMLLQRATIYPDNLGEGKLVNAKENDIYYWLGVAYLGLKDALNANICFTKATQGENEPASMMFYNDQPPEMIFYQGLALKALGRYQEASAQFDKLISYGQRHLHDQVSIDFFAVSLPDLLIFDDDMDQRNYLHCMFMTALGQMGKGEKEEACKLMDEVLAADPNHQVVTIHKELLKWML